MNDDDMRRNRDRWKRRQRKRKEGAIDRRVLMTVMRKTWQERPPIGNPRGDRIFARYVNVSEENPSWDDWKLAALIRGEEVEPYIDMDPDTVADIRRGLATGQLTGESEQGDTWWQWVRSSLDGPPGPRLLDRVPAADPRRN